MSTGRARTRTAILLFALAPAAVALGAGITVSDTILANGLRVVVYENHSAPVAVAEVWYKVGAHYEHSGYTGISHLLEHMMFKGTRQYGPGEYSRLVEAQGGEENAFTSDNYMVCWAALASDRYELELKLEADRMQNLTLDSVEFERERNVVMEERRLGENEPTDVLWEDFYATAFKIHPARNPVIGWMDDLERLRREDLVRHYQTYCTPGNATLVVAGDVVPGTVFARAVKHFGKIKSHPVPPWNPVEPPQNGERSLEVRRDIMTPTLMIGYHVPGSDNPDFYAFEVLEGLLSGGRSSRLYARLVYRKGLALNGYGGNDTEREPGLFYFYAVPHSVTGVDSLEAAIYAEIESLKTIPVRDSELTRVKNQVVANFVYARDRSQGMAGQIGRSISMYGSVDYLNRYPERIAAVTKDDIMRAVTKYFVKDNRTVGKLLPVAHPAEPTGPRPGKEDR